MAWSLPVNLALRKSAVLVCYPKVVVYALGDAKHLAFHSDHNPDSRGVVHALDVMTAAGTAQAAATLRWLLADTTDLEYVIHDHKIYSRSRGFKAAAYNGSDPHTNHIHVSGKHGSVGENNHTGTGYDLAAESYRPKGTPCKPYVPPKPPTTSKDEIMDVILPAGYGGDGVKTISAERALSSLMRYVLETRNEVLEVQEKLKELEAKVSGSGDGLTPEA